MKKATNKILSFLSAFAMVLGILVAPFTSANAAETGDISENTTVEDTANPDDNKPEEPSEDEEKPADDKDNTADNKEESAASKTTVVLHKIKMNSLEGFPKSANEGESFITGKDGKTKYDGNQIDNISGFFGDDAEGLAGVKFYIYKVNDENDYKQMLDEPANYDTVEKVEELLGKDAKPEEVTTTKEGVEIDLEDGNYWFVEDADSSLSGDDEGKSIADAAAVPFGLTLPVFNSDGKRFDTNDKLHVYPKNTLLDQPKVDKDFAGKADANKDRNEIDNTIVEDVNVGDEVPYEIETLVPVNAEYKTSAWTDQMTEGLTFNKDSMKVAIGPKDSETALDDADYTVKEDGNGFALELTESGLDKINGQKEETRVHITYSATVNDKAKVQRPERNDVIFHFGNNPGHGNTPYPTKPNQETGELAVEKDFPEIEGGWSEGEEVKATLVDAHTGKPVEFTDDQEATVTLTGDERTHTWKNLDKDRQYKVVEEFTPGDEVTYVKDKDGSIKIEDRKTTNPNPLNPQEPAVVTYGHRFQKVNQEGTGLEGAEFVVKKDNKYLTVKDGKELAADQEAYVKAEKAYKDAVAKATEENPDKENIATLKEARDKAYEKAQSEWIFEDSKDNAAVFKSDEDGFFKVTGIKPGDYQLEETKAPKGYSELKDPIGFTVDKDSEGETTLDAGKLKDDKGFTQVVNKKVTIPQTGGIGSLIFIVAGVAIMAIAFAMKKRNSYEEA